MYISILQTLQQLFDFKFPESTKSYIKTPSITKLYLSYHYFMAIIDLFKSYFFLVS